MILTVGAAIFCAGLVSLLLAMRSTSTHFDWPAGLLISLGLAVMAAGVVS